MPFTTTGTATTTTTTTRRAKKYAMAKRGLKSLGFAVGVPFFLTIFTIYSFGLSRGYAGLTKSFWYPPIWIMHLASISSASLMGLSAWLVWAEGGFHQPSSSLPLVVSQFFLGLLWGPLTLSRGATHLGMVVCIMFLAVLYGCSQRFKKVNPIAGDLVKPCIAWAAFLAIINYKLL